MSIRQHVNSSFDVHDARPHELRGLAEVHVRTWQAAYRGLVPDDYLDGLSIDVFEKRWHANAERAIPLVVVDGGVVIGFASFGPSRDDDCKDAGELNAIYVEPSHWKRGFGSALMSHVIERLRAGGYAKATLWTLEGNLETRRFYERCEWTLDGSRRTHAVGGAELATVRYERSL